MRPRPIEVHPHSKGSKRFIVQDIIANHHRYFYISLNGKQKTDLYNKGFIDGQKSAIPFTMYGGLEERNNLKEAWLLVLPKELIPQQYILGNKFVGRMGATSLYILKVDELQNFEEYSCTLGGCPFYGKSDCYKTNPYDCSKPNRKRHVAGRYSYAK